jgi:hypothetical protein
MEILSIIVCVAVIAALLFLTAKMAEERTISRLRRNVQWVHLEAQDQQESDDPNMAITAQQVNQATKLIFYALFNDHPLEARKALQKPNSCSPVLHDD